MIIIPAIDIKGGKCVRLLQGRMDAETVFSDNPSAMAAQWAADGAELIHIVDLDGAVRKSPQNLDAVKKILETVDVPVQLGGGIRDEETIRMYLDIGIRRVIIGTEAIRNPEMVKAACKAFPGQIVVGIDAREGWVAIEGWTETTRTRATDLAREFEDSGVAAINFTDIHRDGMQSGPNIEETRKLAASVSIPVVASGGVSALADIRNLIPLEPEGVVGVITGRALYSGTLNLREAIALSKGVVSAS
ncbi:1-(5-phosphoribosyl)-5-((5-phosphoribosylamino) m ethylideneamino)imidazole-4-carboxamide isomerase [Desulfonema ishimotonii]|uniref:1-(5-phosphoribosyl)-5-[(5-phosphoribosylamino)methylideneamino] imidazole-4-carboxamide isomerase n=1 Tax=Desulfonema ishimotonii TaxID=45657 RepID=A0A401FSY6_9BACT|nr:1-(5-phosphoribosyl)-5-[(5-phosphoribosylamino)methylideneamino]imidazole-4-carboxamide isomerase [Desulfonema ishimotonii]GBC60075.1 1-(5-phosphoribosyl)-5-((5-phosphoribosylamino) m ethylideneamino)imidazole-4-carboxamide isomerase [Desulfonema ishimotonii]